MIAALDPNLQACLDQWGENFLPLVQGDAGDCAFNPPDPADFPCQWAKCSICHYDDFSFPFSAEIIAYQQIFSITCDGDNIILTYTVQLSGDGPNPIPTENITWQVMLPKASFDCLNFSVTFGPDDVIGFTPGEGLMQNQTATVHT